MASLKSPAGKMIEDLRAKAIEEDVPVALADHAARATYSVFRNEVPHRALSRRVESYFRTVLARRLAKDRSGSRAKSRLIAASVVADLRESGRESVAVWDELQRGWAGMIPDDVLEEFRTQLCA